MFIGALSGVPNKSKEKFERVKEFNLDVIEEIHQQLLNHDVVDGPPELKELVEELWPQLLHKLKPPLELMH